MIRSSDFLVPFCIVIYRYLIVSFVLPHLRTSHELLSDFFCIFPCALVYKSCIVSCVVSLYLELLQVAGGHFPECNIYVLNYICCSLVEHFNFFKLDATSCMLYAFIVYDDDGRQLQS